MKSIDIRDPSVKPQTGWEIFMDQDGTGRVDWPVLIIYTWLDVTGRPRCSFEIPRHVPWEQVQRNWIDIPGKNGKKGVIEGFAEQVMNAVEDAKALREARWERRREAEIAAAERRAQQPPAEPP